jgi:hypothetical protein
MVIRRDKLAIVGTAILALALALPLPALGKAGESYTGEVSDSMCGAEHMMKGSKADCTRACVGKGSNYALVVGDKVYTLETNDRDLLGKLNDLAGQKARITGKADGTGIVVNAVAPAK